MEKIKVAVIGTGRLGRFHTKIIKDLPDVDLIGIYDIDAARLKSVADEFKVEAFDDPDDLLNLCDAAIVASTTSTHKDIVLRAIDAGCHVLVEKPIAESATDGRVMVEAADIAGKVLMVGHVEHFNPAFGVARPFLKRPQFIESHRLTIYRGRGADVSVVHDLLIHDLELILALIDEDIVDMRASGGKVLTNSLDIANVRIEFLGGCVANVTASRISLSNVRKMRFFSDGAYVSIDFGGKVEIASLIGDGPKPPDEAERFDLPGGETIARWFVPVPDGNALQIELENFMDCIRTGEEPLVSGRSGLKALELADRIVEEIGIAG